ncbi:polyprenyl synthetase family protein [Streptomyces sp. NPDC002851]
MERTAADLVAVGMAEAVATLPAPLRAVAEHHLGLAAGQGGPAGSAGLGKCVRAALTLASAVAGGGREADAVAGAVAVELLHNFTLLHDDIMDGDRTRRHRTSAWVEFGVPAALLTGDALLVLALRVVTDLGIPAAGEAVQRSLQDLMHGQSADMSFQRRGDVSWDSYLEMASDKSGSLTSTACTLGATLAHAAPEVVDALCRFGRHLGVAFQCVDDVLGIWGDPARTGKPVGTDLLAGKKTLPVLAALAAGGAPARQVDRLYRDGGIGTGLLREMTDVIEQAGGRAAAEAEARRQIDLAQHCLEREDIASPGRAALRALAAEVIHRDH